MTRLLEPLHTEQVVTITHCAPSQTFPGMYVLATDKGNMFIRSVPDSVRAVLKTQSKASLIVLAIEKHITAIVGFTKETA